MASTQVAISWGARAGIGRRTGRDTVTIHSRGHTVPTPGEIRIGPGEVGRLIVRLPYSPECIAKIKTVAGRRWHQEKRCWTVPHIPDTLARLLALFADRPVEVDPALRPAKVRDDQPARADPDNPDMSASPAGLFDRVRQAIRARHYSPRTEQAYLAWIVRFVRFHEKRRPEDMGEPEVNEFLTHLAVDERVAASTQN